MALTSVPLQTLMSGASPSSATTTAQTGVTGLDAYTKAVVYAIVQGGTGGALDIYIQSSQDNGTTWYDVVHYTQLSAGAAQTAYVTTLGRGAQPGTAPVAVNKTSATPVLAAGTTLPGALGNALRVVCVAGASTSAGAAQTITAYLSK